MKNQLILAIDTSCDDTSAAVTRGTAVLSNVIASQTQLHKPYGGVFPTVAKLAHKENIDKTIEIALQRAGVKMTEIAALAVTVGPGLAPALEVGIAKAKELALLHKKTLIPVNHVEGHVLSVLAHPAARTKRSANMNTAETTQAHATAQRTELETYNPQSSVKLPALSLIVSGGHTQFVLVKNFGEYEILGSTLDDAAGECLDKIGRMLNLGYPAGPVMEEFAKLGNKDAYPFPLPLTTVKTFDVSFSGMKTFARNTLDSLTLEKPLNRQEIYDFCASAQYGVFRHVCYKLTKILEDMYVNDAGANPVCLIKEVWLGGGVAANMTLRKMLRETIRESTTKHAVRPLRLRTPYTKKLCADNAAMIGVVAGMSKEVILLVNNAISSLERQPQLKIK